MLHGYGAHEDVEGLENDKDNEEEDMVSTIGLLALTWSQEPESGIVASNHTWTLRTLELL